MVTVIKISINRQIYAARACELCDELCEDNTHHMTILSISQEELTKSMHNEFNSTCHDLGKMTIQEPSETYYILTVQIMNDCSFIQIVPLWCITGKRVFKTYRKMLSKRCCIA